MAPQSGKAFRALVGIPPSHPTTADSVLVIVDAQNEYDHGQLAIVDVKKSRAVIGEVLKKYRDAGGDVVHVLHDTPSGAPVSWPIAIARFRDPRYKSIQLTLACRCSRLVMSWRRSLRS